MNTLLSIYRLKNRLFRNFKFCQLPFAGSFFSKLLTDLRREQNVNGVTTEVGVYFTDSADSLGILRNGDYGKMERELFRKLIPHNGCVLDIGANIGFFSVFFSKLIRPHGLVYSFEPSPEMYSLLLRNLDANEASNVRSHMIAVGDSNSTTKLFLNASNSGDNRLFPDADTSESIDCTVRKLDDMPALRESPIDFIKIDVQGHEFFALKGMNSIINKNPHVRIFCEFWPYGLKLNNTNPQDLYELFVSLGFIIYDFNGGHGLKKIQNYSDLSHLTPESKMFTDLVCSQTILES